MTDFLSEEVVIAYDSDDPAAGGGLGDCETGEIKTSHPLHSFEDGGFHAYEAIGSASSDLRFLSRESARMNG